MHTTPNQIARKDSRTLQRRVMVASVLIALLMLGGKLTAYFITGSAAILSDAVESVVHLFATAFAAFSLWYAVQPPDERHPYGHGKIAYFSSGFEGALIMVAAFFIVYSAAKDLIVGPDVQQLGIGLLITGGLMLINLALGVALVRVGRQHDSIVVESNGQHVLTDMWTSLGVLVGIGLVQLTGAVWLDPVTAILVGLNILWTAGSLMKRSYMGLMEAVRPEDVQAIEVELDRAEQQGLIAGWHELRHRRVYAHFWIEYHLLFPDELSIQEAHLRCSELDGRVRDLFPGLEVVVTAHFEPARTHDLAHPHGHEAPGPA